MTEHISFTDSVYGLRDMPITNTALAAAALQDEWRRALSLSTGPVLRRPKHLPPLENKIGFNKKRIVNAVVDTGLSMFIVLYNQYFFTVFHFSWGNISVSRR